MFTTQHTPMADQRENSGNDVSAREYLLRKITA